MREQLENADDDHPVWLVNDVREPDIHLGEPGDFDTPMLPGFEVNIGAQESHGPWGKRWWVYVVEDGGCPRSGVGIAQRATVDGVSHVRVDSELILRKLESTAVLVEVRGSRNWREIVKRAIERVYYERAVRTREAA